METKKLFNKKITQWLLLVAMLVGCSANAWADSAAGQVIYMQPGSNWGQASATFKMKGELSGTYSSAVSMTKVCDNSGETDDLYSATVSSSREYNKLQFLRYNPEGTSQWCYSATQNYESGKNFIAISNNCNGASFSSGYGWLCNNTIYFDNTETNWDKVYLRVGHDSYNSKYDMEKVEGTANLYKYTIPSWVGFKAWGIANNVAWAGSHSIYSTCQNDDTYDITGHTDYIKESVTTDYTVIAGSDCTQGTGDKDKCTYFYSRTTYQSKKTWTVTITTPTNGSISVSYKDESGTDQEYTSGSKDVLPTCIITVTATPNTGYKLESLTVGGASISSGDTYNVRSDVSIVATFEVACTKPTAGSIGGTTSICAGNGTTLTLSGQTAGTNLQWYKSTDGSLYNPITDATGKQLSTGNLNTNSYYKVRVSRTDDASCYSETEVTTVTVNPLPTASISGNDAVCQNGSLQLTGSGGTSYSWNGGEYGTTDTYIVTTTSAGQQTIKLKVKDDNGCESTEASKTVTIKANPSISSIAAGTGNNECGTGNVTFNSTGATSGATIQWYEGSSQLKEGTETSYTIEIAGGSSKTLKAKAVKEGCESSFTAEATGARKAAPAISATPSNTTAYEVITLTSTSGSVLLWSKDAADTRAYFVKNQMAVDGNTVEAASVNFKAPAKVGAYTVTAKGGNDCTSNVSITIGTAQEECGN